MLIDLQLHSTYSDGYLTPTQLADFVYKKGVRVAALTDHNTVAGVDEFRHACKKRNIKPIVGVELYVKLGHKRFNILWLNIKNHHPSLHNLLRESQIRRRGNVRRALEALKQRGFSLDIPKIIDKHTHYIPINKIVDDIWVSSKNQKIIKKELNDNNPREPDIIKKYLKNPEYTMLRESYINIERVLKLRKKIGGQIILNHPAKFRGVTRQTIEKLKIVGVDGIEVLSPHHSLGAVMYLQYIARDLDFISTGGSDFHRHEGKSSKVQNSWDYFKIHSSKLRKINKIIG